MAGYIAKLSALFRWAVREGLIDRNPAERLMLPEDTHKRDARLPFSDDQLNLILSSDIFRRPTESWDHRQWVFLIGLFAGLRLNEACTISGDFDAVYSDASDGEPDDDRTIHPTIPLPGTRRSRAIAHSLGTP